MMGDLPALAPCPASKRGGHEMVAITREGEDIITLACCVCGAVRRISSVAPPLDDMDAAEIARRIGAHALPASLNGTETR